MTLGEKIANRRSAVGMSQLELANLIEVNSAKVISNWENDLHKPDVEKLGKICTVLGCSPSYFVEYSGGQDEFSDEERDLIQKYRHLDKFGKDVVLSNMNVQYERCTTKDVVIEETSYEKDVDIVFLNKNDKDYESVKSMIPKLRTMKENSFLSSDSIRRFLANKGYEGKLSIADVLLIERGIKIPSRSLYNAYMDILKMSQKK